jgi:NAD(P)-dependent dehydrogenase (short-subunit alcohol dehydrogenase family)
MIELVGRAEEHLRAHGAWDVEDGVADDAPAPAAVAALRNDLSRAAGRPLVVTWTGRSGDLGEQTQRGPATPDHVLRTKRVPLLGRDVDAYAAAYRAYFEEHAHRGTVPLTMLDPAPRVVVDPELGLLAAGTSAAAASAAADVYLHTVDVIARAELLEEWRALPAADVFDVEYWELEQAKLAQAGAPRPLEGEVALVTGAASGIGRACALHLLELGAAVVGFDLDPQVAAVAGGAAYLGIEGDVTCEESLERALEQAVCAFGGLDVLVLNAGIFPESAPIAELDLAAWQRTMRVNVDANVALMRRAFPLLALAPNGGRVVVNASKNVPAPGPGAAAYSASKAALTQLARVAALEWGAAGIRVNVVHPNAVFDTQVWSDDVIRRRAESYGLSVEDYRRNNVLRTEVTSRDVARLVGVLCGPAFAKTTGAQIPVDGGNDRVI